MVIVFGDANNAVAESYPKDALTSQAATDPVARLTPRQKRVRINRRKFFTRGRVHIKGIEIGWGFTNRRSPS